MAGEVATKGVDTDCHPHNSSRRQCDTTASLLGQGDNQVMVLGDSFLAVLGGAKPYS